jgi:hypothetical protein
MGTESRETSLHLARRRPSGSTSDMPWRRTGRPVGGLTFLLAFFVCTAAQAQAPHARTFWDRLTLDVGYELSYFRGLYTFSAYTHDPESGRQVSALMYVHYHSLSQGLGVDVAFSVKPRLGIGLDCHLQQAFTAPTHPWFQTLGIQYGAPRAISLGAFLEFRPWQRDYEPRRGFFLRAGGREVWMDLPLTRTADVVSPTDGHGRQVQGWVGVGYRIAVRSSVSLHLLADMAAGLDNYEGRLRLGGGFQ